jgi:hypothetical protein
MPFAQTAPSESISAIHASAQLSVGTALQDPFCHQRLSGLPGSRSSHMLPPARCRAALRRQRMQAPQVSAALTARLDRVERGKADNPA